MEVTGKIKDIVKDFVTGKFLITLAINEDQLLLSEYDKLKDVDKLSISIRKWHKKRSLDANAYCWVLISKIAQAISSSKEEVYEEMLRRYGTYYQDENGYITITVNSRVDMSKVEGHWQKIKESGEFTSYLMIKGSSEYDTAEMCKLIDGICSECHDLGIETLTPNEIERLKAQWKA